MHVSVALAEGVQVGMHAPSWPGAMILISVLLVISGKVLQSPDNMQ